MKKILDYTINYTKEIIMKQFIQEHGYKYYTKDDRYTYAASPRGSIIMMYADDNDIVWRYLRDENSKVQVVRIGDKVVKVNKIIATLFCKNDVAGYAEIHHLDGDLSNCRADNLEWRSRKQRILEQQADKFYRIKRGLKKLSDDDDYEDLSDVIIMKLED